MDELLSDFLNETADQIEGIESQLVAFEQDPSDPAPITSIFRLVHTIKGTSSFLGLDRLQRVAHSAETLLGHFRDGVQPTRQGVSLILAAMDRIKAIIQEVEARGEEAEGDDSDVTGAIDALCDGGFLDGQPEAAQPAGPETPAVAAAEADTAAEESLDTDAKAGMPASSSANSNGNAAAAVAVATSAPESIRVNVGTIERIMELVSELVLTRNQLLELTRNREGDTVKTPLQRLSALTTDLQDAVMRARMQPVGRLFASLPRLVRELSVELSKKIELSTSGADTELDRQLIEVIRDPLTHLIRNCADHGIETPEVRAAAGKSETGLIQVSAFHEAGQITLEVSDDGKGLDVEKIKAKGIRSGLVSEQEAAALSDEEIYRFIFEAGFSTAQAVTTVSGRGVGMDVVRTNIESVGGSISLTSKPGQGSRFFLRIPLTLAIAPALILEAGSQRFALPQNAVVEAVALGGDSRHRIEKLQNALVLRLRDEVIPVIDLRAMLDLAGTAEANAESLVVVVRIGATSFGVVVDTVSDVQEIVVKPLSASLAHLKVFSGHTILGDGSVVLILDPAGLANCVNVQKSAEKLLKSSDGHAHRDTALLLQFRAGSGATKVVPLEFVSRIVNAETSSIQSADGRLVMLHQERLMPVLPVGGPANLDRPFCPVLVISVQGVRFGLLVDEVLDIMDERVDIELTGESAETVGAIKLKGHAVEFVDVMHFMNRSFPERAASESHEGNILLIGDDLLTRTIIAPAIAGAGYRVRLAASAAEAAELLEDGLGADVAVASADLFLQDAEDLMKAMETLSHTLPLVRLVDQEGAAHQAGAHFPAATALKLCRKSILRTLAQVMRAAHGDAALADSDNDMNKDLAA